jgi:hypothetical protein
MKAANRHGLSGKRIYLFHIDRLLVETCIDALESLINGWMGPLGQEN